ncbi:MAG: hypothetical protein WCR24_06945 [Candidatus Methanomethylophilaceae archaeon]
MKTKAKPTKKQRISGSRSWSLFSRRKKKSKIEQKQCRSPEAPAERKTTNPIKRTARTAMTPMRLKKEVRPCVTPVDICKDMAKNANEKTTKKKGRR